MSPEPGTPYPAPPVGSNAKRNFILQQGLGEPADAACPLQYSALLFQPRLVGVSVVIAATLQSPVLFVALAAVLWWCALAPHLNPFDALYNATLARRSSVLLASAPPPRRFAQFLAGAFALSIGVSIIFGWRATTLALEAFFVVAVGALAFGGLCVGSFVFHLLRGRIAFAARTLPWASGP